MKSKILGEVSEENIFLTSEIIFSKTQNSTNKNNIILTTLKWRMCVYHREP